MLLDPDRTKEARHSESRLPLATISAPAPHTLKEPHSRRKPGSTYPATEAVDRWVPAFAGNAAFQVIAPSVKYANISVMPLTPSRRGLVPPFIAMDVLREALAREAAGYSVIHLEVRKPG